MTRDVDALNRGPHYKEANAYNAMAYTLHKQDYKEFQSAYSTSVLSSLMNHSKYILNNRTTIVSIHETAMDVTIMLVDCCPLTSDKEYIEAILVSCPKSSTVSMVNCNKSSMNSMVNYNNSSSDNTVL